MKMLERLNLVNLLYAMLTGDDKYLSTLKEIIMVLYKGYSSFEYQRKKTFSLTDIELVKMNLLNHIFTRKGSRVMMPSFGSIVPDLVFEPLDNQTLSILEDELVSIIDFDPRIQLMDIRVAPDFDNNAVVVGIQLNFLEFNIVENMDLNIIFEG